ncbi:MAG TPA: hypothetical protein V6D18_15395 [Thermosynechococcaceae cyanobacterium]
MVQRLVMGFLIGGTIAMSASVFGGWTRTFKLPESLVIATAASAGLLNVVRK